MKSRQPSETHSLLVAYLAAAELVEADASFKRVISEPVALGLLCFFCFLSKFCFRTNHYWRL